MIWVEITLFCVTSNGKWKGFKNIVPPQDTRSQLHCSSQ